MAFVAIIQDQQKEVKSVRRYGPRTFACFQYISSKIEAFMHPRHLASEQAILEASELESETKSYKAILSTENVHEPINLELFEEIGIYIHIASKKTLTKLFSGQFRIRVWTIS